MPEMPEGNPFATKEERAAAFNEIVNKEPEPEAKAEEEVVEAKVVDPFADVESDIVADPFGPEDEADLPEDEIVQPKEGEKGEPMMRVSVFKKRIGKVTAQKRKALDDSEVLAKERLEALAERDLLRNSISEWREEYKENPELAIFDAKFMNALTKLGPQHEDVAKLAQSVAEYVKTGQFKGLEVMTVPEAKEEAAPTRDPAVVRILEREARQTARAVLEDLNIAPQWVAVLTDAVVTATGENELTMAGVKQHAKAWLDEKGIKGTDVLKISPDVQAKEEKPKTGEGSGKSAAKPVSKKEASDEAQHAEPPKTKEDWESRREARRQAFFGETGS